METALCSGCQERNVRLAALEAELARQQQTIRRLQASVDRLTQRLAQYEPDVRREQDPPAAAAENPSASYSLDAEQKRRRRRRRKKSPGRRPTELKFALAERFQDVYPAGVRHDVCQLVRERAVWRLEDGRAVRVGYRIFAGSGGVEPPIPGVTPRCEYGLEVLVVLAFLVYIIGISLDKACAVLGFFCHLPLAKSQADALLRQLAQHWQAEFDTLCDLLGQAAVVYLDETSWRVGKAGCSLWAFATDQQRVFVFGCHKDDTTLDRLLPPEVFGGIGVSDDYAVYRDRFVRAQKCWAHLLRKAIRLALLYPRRKKYRRFLDRLLALYHEAQRAAEDGRLGPAGRLERVTDLENRLYELCLPYYQEPPPQTPPPEHEFGKLVSELVRLALASELFTFVLHPEVQPTNNLLERLLRGPALDRKAGRVNQTAAGAQRRSIIVSVLESLRVNLEQFTLASVLEEVNRWLKEGVSLFAKQWQALQPSEPAAVPNTS